MVAKSVLHDHNSGYVGGDGQRRADVSLASAAARILSVSTPTEPTTDAPSTKDASAASPVDKARAAKLAEWERRTTAWIIISAILPIATAFGPDQHSTFKAIINVVCWLVFVVDLIVHMRLSSHYLRTGRGRFDLVIVLVTAPWFLVTGGSSQYVVIARLARLARVVMASTRSNRLKHLVNQLGNVAAYALGLLLVVALIEKAIEPASSGFATYGDAVWWGFVTLTTVGYGDIFPVTAGGRIAAVILMLGGVAFLGTLAGTLAAFFGVGADGKPVQYDDHGDAIIVETEPDGATTAIEVGPSTSTAVAAPGTDVSSEVAALRAAVEALTARLESTKAG